MAIILHKKHQKTSKLHKCLVAIGPNRTWTPIKGGPQLPNPQLAPSNATSMHKSQPEL